MTTEERINKIKKLLDAATPGPWFVLPEHTVTRPDGTKSLMDAEVCFGTEGDLLKGKVDRLIYELDKSQDSHVKHFANVAEERDQLAKENEKLRELLNETDNLVRNIESEMQLAGPQTGPIYYGEIAKAILDWHVSRKALKDQL